MSSLIVPLEENGFFVPNELKEKSYIISDWLLIELFSPCGSSSREILTEYSTNLGTRKQQVPKFSDNHLE